MRLGRLQKGPERSDGTLRIRTAGPDAQQAARLRSERHQRKDAAAVDPLTVATDFDLAVEFARQIGEQGRWSSVKPYFTPISLATLMLRWP